MTLNVTVTDGACNATCSKDVTIDTTPTCNITCDPASCADCDQVRLTANATGGAGNYTYLWSTNETTQSINVTVSGNYSVTVTDSNNCTGSCNKTVTMYEHPTSCNVTCDPPTCVDPEQVTLTAHCTIGFEELPTSGAKATFGAGECTYLWSTGETTQSITVTSSGNYSVTVTAGVHECSKACSKIVTICKRPPAMVPAVNQWGIVAMIALFAGLVVWTVRKRRLAS